MNITKNLGMLLLAIYLILNWNHDALSHYDRPNRDGDPGARGKHLDSDRQVALGDGIS